jgi:hypothetical protein
MPQELGTTEYHSIYTIPVEVACSSQFYTSYMFNRSEEYLLTVASIVQVCLAAEGHRLISQELVAVCR